MGWSRKFAKINYLRSCDYGSLNEHNILLYTGQWKAVLVTTTVSLEDRYIKLRSPYIGFLHNGRFYNFGLNIRKLGSSSHKSSSAFILISISNPPTGIDVTNYMLRNSIGSWRSLHWWQMSAPVSAAVWQFLLLIVPTKWPLSPSV